MSGFHYNYFAFNQIATDNIVNNWLILKSALGTHTWLIHSFNNDLKIIKIKNWNYKNSKYDIINYSYEKFYKKWNWILLNTK